MSSKSIYTSIILAKNETEIPVLENGRTVDSKYNPQREAVNLISSIMEEDNLIKENKSSIFFIVIGIGSGTFLEQLGETFPHCKIIGIERSISDLQFLNKLKKIEKLKENNNIILTSIEDVEKIIVNNYLPGIFSYFKIIEQRAWCQENKDIIPLLSKKINKAFELVSADYSVQAHFGKIWQSNIINNLRTLTYAKVHNYSNFKIEKTAVIVAAGPSVDTTINYIKSNRNDYYVIATDTAFSVLIKQEITPDIVVSIDGQHISHNHFFNHVSSRKNTEETLFLLDLCSDYSIGRFLQSKNYNVSYFISGHPLASLANSFSRHKFLYLYSGAGTVTITAIDLAIKLGFTNIEIYGADFSYINGKSYGKGTYFDSILGINDCKINSMETQYDKLMFRTELIKKDNNQYYTEILNAYKMSLEQYLTDNNCVFKKDDYIYKIKSPDNNKMITIIKSFPYDFDYFLSEISKAGTEELKYPLLPYVAWLRNNKYESLEFFALLKLAQYNIVGYN